MPDSLLAAQPADAASTPAERPRRRGALVASIAVASLVIGSMVWGGTAAAQAVAADRRLEAQRVAALGQLLDARSAAGELLAMTARVVATADDAVSPVPDAHATLLAARDETLLELARLLDAESSATVIVAQSRLLERDVDALIASLDDHTRAIIEHGRTVAAAAPLASTASRAELDEAIADLAVEKQGLPSSYSGRGALVADVLSAASAAQASHAAEKAERERREAARRAAEEARQASQSRRPPKKAFVTLVVQCGIDEFGQIIWCEERVEVIS